MGTFYKQAPSKMGSFSDIPDTHMDLFILESPQGPALPDHTAQWSSKQSCPTPMSRMTGVQTLRDVLTLPHQYRREGLTLGDLWGPRAGFCGR